MHRVSRMFNLGLSILIFASVMILAGFAASSGPRWSGTVDRATLHHTVHFTEQITRTDGVDCTATAIGKHALLTATHCELGTDEITIDTAHDAVKAHIVKRIRDGSDHTIYLLEGVSFKDVAEIGEAPVQGDHVFMWGNPGNEHDQYREGIVEGTADVEKHEAILIDMRVHSGDSGSALFSDGKIVGVLSGTYGDQQMTSADIYPLKFKAEQINKAREF